MIIEFRSRYWYSTSSYIICNSLCNLSRWFRKVSCHPKFLSYGSCLDIYRNHSHAHNSKDRNRNNHFNHSESRCTAISFFHNFYFFQSVIIVLRSYSLYSRDFTITLASRIYHCGFVFFSTFIYVPLLSKPRGVIIIYEA